VVVVVVVVGVVARWPAGPVAWQQATTPAGHQGNQATRPPATRPASHQTTKATNQQKLKSHLATSPPSHQTKNTKNNNNITQRLNNVFVGGLKSGTMMTKCLLFLLCLVSWLAGLVAWQQATRPPSHQGNKPKPNHEQLGHQHFKPPNPKSKKQQKQND
jgi:hypothetical protein